MKWPTGRTLGGISALGQRPGTRLGQFQDGQFTSAGLHDFTASLWAAGYRTLHSWLYLVYAGGSCVSEAEQHFQGGAARKEGERG